VIQRGKIRSTILRLACAALCASVPSAAEIINFDDIDASAGDVILDSLSPYHGFDWKNFSIYTSTPGFPGFNNGIVSAPSAAYTAGDALGSPIVSSITATSPFNFISGDFGSGWYDGLNVTVNGLDNGTQEFSKTVTVNTQGTQLFTFNFTSINELDIFSTVTSTTTDPFGCGPSGCSEVTLDDLTLTPAPSSVPEPSPRVLLGFVVLALAAARHLKQISKIS
jgi:hypothetical protein